MILPRLRPHLATVAVTLAFFALFIQVDIGLALDHSGLLAGDETWLAADNPHNVVGHLTVGAGFTLTLEPGVEVYTGDNLRIDIFGDLVAVGTAGQEILFTQGTANNWNYLRFLSGGNGTIDYCTIEYSNNGIHAAGTGTITVDNSRLRNNTYAIYSVSTATLSVGNCQIQDNSYGAYATGGSIDLASVTFTGNITYGFYGQNVAAGLADGNNIFTDNSTGFRVDDVSGVDLSAGLTVTGSTVAGIHLEDCDAPTLDNLVLTGNTGSEGAMFLDDCGEITLGGGNSIGGQGLENSWPLTLGAGSYPMVSAVIPQAFNGSNHIQVKGGSSTRVGTWRNFAGLNYIVTGNLTILSGGGLTLEPGVEVYLDDARRVDIYGTLTAVGTPGQEILFSKWAETSWNYLRFLAAGQGEFDYCIIENAFDGIRALGAGAITVANTTLRSNSYAIYATGTSALAASGCQFQDNSVGIYASGGTIDLSSTVFTGNTTYGFYGEGLAADLTDAAVSFTDNATGYRVDGIAGLVLDTTLNVSGSTVAGIHLFNCADPSIDNQILRGNNGFYGALLLEGCGDFTLGAGNSSGGSGFENSWPVSVDAGSFPAAVSLIPASGNTNNSIQVLGGSFTQTVNWPSFPGVDYVITGDLTIPAEFELTLAAGVGLSLGNGRGLEIYGSLNAAGVEGQEIMFTQHADSNWSHLKFHDEGTGSFTYCTIEFADAGLHAGGAGIIAAFNVILQNNSFGALADGTSPFTLSTSQVRNNSHGLMFSGGTLNLGSTTFSGNTTYGFYGLNVAPVLADNNVVFTDNATGFRVDGVDDLSLTTPLAVSGSSVAGIHLVDCEAPTIDNQVLTGNIGDLGALFLDDCGEFNLGAGNTIGGPGLENSWPLTLGAGSYPAAAAVVPNRDNLNNDIQVAGGQSDRTGTWRLFTDLNYVVTDTTTILAGGGLDLEPGLEVRLEPDIGLEIFGTLNAVGVLEEEILITQNAGAAWSRLRFLGDGGGSFHHCIIENAATGIQAVGSGTLDFFQATLRNNSTGIHSIDQSPLSVADCLFQNNGHGIHLTGGSVALASTTFSGNGLYGFLSQGVAPDILDDNLIFSGNGWGFALRDVPEVGLVKSMTLAGNFFGGIHLQGCDEPSLDNQILTDHTGLEGAIRLIDCGEFTLGAGNTIGGPGKENTWAVTISPDCFPSASGVIPVTGNLNNDIQVITAGSPRTGSWPKLADLDYIINDEVLVSGELTLEPGVNLRFGSETGLVVSGTLNAIGTPEQVINFTGQAAESWKHLGFITSGTGTFDHCFIENADSGIQAFGSGAIAISNSTLQNHNYGLYATGSGDITVTGVSFLNNNNGVRLVGSPAVSLSDCLLENNAYGVWASGGTIAFLRDRIINNTSFGVFLHGVEPTFGSSLAEWNDIYGNGTGQPGRDLQNGSTDIEARFVHWGSMDHGEVLTRIWDQRDDPGLGYVQLLPFINAAHDGEITGVEDPHQDPVVPVAFGLAQNAPNPFNPSTVIRFDLAGPSAVKLKVYDVSGALVTTLVDEQLPAGRHQAVWYGRDDQGRSVPSGMYIYRIAAGPNLETRRMTLLK